MVEAALTLLIFVSLLIGVMETARILNIQQTLSSAAREGARVSVMPLRGTGNLPDVSLVRDTVQRTLDAAAVSGATITVERPVSINTGGTLMEFTRVTVAAPYNIVALSWFGRYTINLTGRAVMRNETSP